MADPKSQTALKNWLTNAIVLPYPRGNPDDLDTTDYPFGEPEDHLNTQQSITGINAINRGQMAREDGKGPYKLPDLDNPKEGLENFPTENAQRLAELKRSPTDWDPQTITILDAVAQQIVPYRAWRQSIALFAASANLQISNRQGPKPAKCVTLIATSGVIEMETEGPFWVIGGTPGTTLQVIETFYDIPRLSNAQDEYKG